MRKYINFIVPTKCTTIKTLPKKRLTKFMNFKFTFIAAKYFKTYCKKVISCEYISNSLFVEALDWNSVKKL